MASYNDYLSSLTPTKTSVNPYAGLFAGSSGSPYKSLSGLFGSAKPTPAPLPTPAKPTPLVSSSPSSTATTPTVVKPPVAPTPASSAKSAYVASLTTPAASPVSSTPPPVASTPPPAPATDPNADSLKAYLATLTNPDLTKARTNLADIQTKNEQAQVDARRGYQAALDASGGLKGGALATAGVTERRNNANLADIALQESAATRNLSALTDATKPIQIGDTYIDPVSGKIIYTKPQDAYTLGEGQVRYDASGNKIAEGPAKDTGITLGKDQSRYQLNPTTGKYELVANGPSSTSGDGSTPGTYVAGANPTVDSWANRIQSGAAKITDIPAAQAGLRNQVTVALDAMGNSPDGKPTTTELGKTALNTAQNLLEKFDKGEGTSAVGKSGFLGSFGYSLIPGTARANFVTDFNSLKSQLSLEGVKYLKGQGQVSDAERALLASAVTKLNLSQSEDEFKKTLTGIIDKLSTGVNTDRPAPVIITKNGQNFDASALSPSELQQALSDGYVQQ